jgi:hypothetical protein
MWSALTHEEVDIWNKICGTLMRNHYDWEPTGSKEWWELLAKAQIKVENK